jgi:hypothetical protein
MDYVMTRELYQELGQIKKFEETADFNRYKKELKWYEDVKSKKTGEYYQTEDLIKRDYALYAMRNGSCSLVLKDETRDRPPYAIDSFDHLKAMEFDTLWDMLSPPKYKMDRSYRDNLDASHIS